MARRYVNPARRAVPDSPENFESELWDLAWSGHFDENEGGRIIRGYADKMAADREIRGQLEGQLRGYQAAVGGVRGWPGNAAGRLYNRSAPAAKLDGMFSGIGDFVKELRARGSRLDQLRRIQDSFGSEIPDAGGALVPEEFRSDLMLASLGSSIVRPRAIVFPAKTARIGVPAIDDTTHATSVMGGVIAYWTEEAAALTESQATYQRVFLDVKKQVAYSTAPNELMADAEVFGVYLQQTLPQALAWWQDKAFISGTGVGEPEGYRSAACQIKVNRGTSSHITFPDIPGMLARLLPQSIDRAIWVCSPSALVDMLGVYQNFGSATSGTIPPSMWVQRGPGGWTLLGMPLAVSEHAAALGSQGDLSLVDLGMYLIADREVATLDISPHLKFNLDVSALRLRSRVDGRYWLGGVITPEDGGSTLSGVVVLN